MARVNPYYSIKKLDVHHVNSACTEGNNIEPENKRYGTGGLPPCKTC